MALVEIIYGEQAKQIEANRNDLLGDVILQSGLPLEQPCAGRGTCGKCKVLTEGNLVDPDEIERMHLSPGELAVGTRLACRARLAGDARLLLAPIVVYSNKIFRKPGPTIGSSSLGLAIDLGSTTVAAFLTDLTTGEVLAGGAGLNQQTVFGADVIARLGAALKDQAHARQLKRLALASINQAIDSLKLSKRKIARIERATIVGNSAMHHLLSGQPVESLARKPFQPHSRDAVFDARGLLEGIFPAHVRVSLPPLIGGFVGSDALACLAFFRFDREKRPLAAIDLGTNGEVLVTDGKRILTASTAAGPAFEGVNISCGSRAVDGAVSAVRWEGDELVLEAISGRSPIGVTGSGLISAVYAFRERNLIEPGGRIAEQSIHNANWISKNENGSRNLILTKDALLSLTQTDIRELQKAKGAIRAALDTLLMILNLNSTDLDRIILTGSFGGQIDVGAALSLGVIPPVDFTHVQPIANGAGFGAAQFLDDAGFERGLALAKRAEQVDLDLVPGFNRRYIGSMRLTPEIQDLSR